MASAGSRQRGLRGSAIGTHAHSWPAAAQREGVVRGKRVSQVKKVGRAQPEAVCLRPRTESANRSSTHLRKAGPGMRTEL
jgi:hypothetical protein